MSKLDKSNAKVIRDIVENMEVPVMGIMQDFNAKFRDEHLAGNHEAIWKVDIRAWLPPQIKRERIEAKIEVLDKLLKERHMLFLKNVAHNVVDAQELGAEIDSLKEQL